MSLRKQKTSQTDTKIDSSIGQTKRMKMALLEELKKYPIVQIACQRTGVGRSTYYKWKDRDHKFAELASAAIAEGKKFTNEMAESQLIKAIGNGHMTGIIYWLKNNHPDYTDKVRYEHHYTHEVELPEKERKEIALALRNIGFANVLKHDGFKYTKEELAEAERTIAVHNVRRKKLEEEIEDLKRKKSLIVGVGTDNIVEKKPIGLDENGTGEEDMTDLDIRPGMTASEFTRQILAREVRRNKEEQRLLKERLEGK